MSTSEIVAWQLGTRIEAEVAAGDLTASEPGRLEWERLSTAEQAARFALGDERFAFWVLRGAQDSLSNRGR